MSNDVATINSMPVTFQQLEKMATSIAKSGLFAVKTPEAALTLLLVAQSEGIAPVQAMMDYQIIQGTPSLKSAAMLARFQRSGGKVTWTQNTDDCVEGKFTHPMGGELTVRWDNARVEKAGLAGKDMHKKFPQQMKRARCISEACRALSPNAIPLGMYTVEEARDMEMIDVTPTATLTEAVTEAAKSVKTAMTTEEFDALILTLDVKTRDELVAAYNAGLKTLKDRGNKDQFDKFKGWRDDMLIALESPTIGD
jgi:hypothetical protein